MQKSHPGRCGASLVDIFILVCFVLHPAQQAQKPLNWIRMSTSGPGRHSVGGRWDSVQHRSATPCLVDLANRPPQKCSICRPARGMEISAPCARALGLSGSLFLHLVPFRDPTSRPLSWPASPFSVDRSRHLKGVVSFSYRSPPRVFVYHSQ